MSKVYRHFGLLFIFLVILFSFAILPEMQAWRHSNNLTTQGGETDEPGNNNDGINPINGMDSTEIVEVGDQTSQDRKPDETSKTNELTGGSSRSSTSVQSDWTQDASVNVTYAFTDHYITSDSLTHYTYFDNDDAIWPYTNPHGVMNTYHDDVNAYHYFIEDTDDDNDYIYFTTNFRINVMTSGVFYYDVSIGFQNDSSSWSDTVDSTLTLSEDFIDAEGQISGTIHTYWTDVASPKGKIQLELWNVTDTDYYSVVSQNVGLGTYAGEWETWNMSIDELRFVQDDITTHIRSEFKQTDSPNIVQWKIDVPNHEYQSEITVELPSYINTSSIEVNPSVTESLSTDTLTLSDTIPITYTITGTYESQKRYLALQEHHTKSFEGSGTALNSTVVHEGSFSDRLTSGSVDFDSTNLTESQYWGFCAVYIESAPSSVDFQYYTSSWQTADSADVSVTNRWQGIFCKLEPTASSSSVTVRLNITGSGVIFVDSFKFYVPDVDVYTSEFHEITVDFAFYNWFEHGLISAEDVKTNVTLWDRTAADKLDDLLNSTKLRSDTWKGKLEFREHEIRIEATTLAGTDWNTTSFYFTPQISGYIYESTYSYDFTNETIEGWGGTGTETASTGYLQAEITSTGSQYVSSPALSGIDENYWTHLVFRVKANESQSSNWVTDQGGTEITATWDVTTKWERYELALDSDFTSSDTEIRLGKSTSSTITYYYDYIYFVHQDSSISCGLSYEFNEESFCDGWMINQGSNLACENGYISVDIVDQYDGIKLWDSTNDETEVEIDTSSFDYILISAYATTAVTFSLSMLDGTTTTPDVELTTTETEFLIANTWAGAAGSLSYNYMWFGEKVGESTAGTLYVNYIRFIESTVPNLQETTTNFFTTSENNTLTSYWTINGSVLDTSVQDLEIVEKNQTEAIHAYSYCVFNDGDSQEVYLPSAFYYWTEDETVPFSVDVQSFYLSDSYIHLGVEATQSCTYTIYENDSSVGSGSLTAETPTVVSHARDTTNAALLNLSYSFVYSGTTVWKNFTYSNADTSTFYLTEYYIIINSTYISINWTSSLSSTTCTAWEDGTLKASDDSTAPTEWVKSTTAGAHYVTLLFERTGYNDLVYEFSYEISAFEITSENLVISDYSAQYAITTSKDDDSTTPTVMLYLNDSAIDFPDGTNTTTPGVIVFSRPGYGFYNFTRNVTWGSQQLIDSWNITITSNAEVTHFVVNIASDYFTVDWGTNKGTAILTMYDNNSAIQTDNTEGLSYQSKDTTEGVHNLEFNISVEGKIFTYYSNYTVAAWTVIVYLNADQRVGVDDEVTLYVTTLRSDGNDFFGTVVVNSTSVTISDDSGSTTVTSASVANITYSVQSVVDNGGISRGYSGEDLWIRYDKLNARLDLLSNPLMVPGDAALIYINMTYQLDDTEVTNRYTFDIYINDDYWQSFETTHQISIPFNSPGLYTIELKDCKDIGYFIADYKSEIITVTVNEPSTSESWYSQYLKAEWILPTILGLCLIIVGILYKLSKKSTYNNFDDFSKSTSKKVKDRRIFGSDFNEKNRNFSRHRRKR